MATDRLGLEITAAHPETVATFGRAMDDYIFFRGEPVREMLSCAESDPEFVVGYCWSGCLRLFGGVGGSHPSVRSALHRARAGRSRVTRREQLHIDAFEHAARGEMLAAGRQWDAILAEYQHDIMAAKCAHEAYHFVGEMDLMRLSSEAILPSWEATSPYYGNVLSMTALGLEETGSYRQAEVLGRKAVEIDPNDCWGVHAVAHVLHMEGRTREEVEWLEETHRHWKDAIWLRGHLWWHLSLPLIEAGEFDRALEIYDRHVSDCDQEMVTRLNDCSSLLWRLELSGVNVGDRWDSLSDKWAGHAGDHAFALAGTHLVMAMASVGCEQALGRYLQSQIAYIAEATSTNSRIVENVGRSICLAIIAFKRGEYGKAVEYLSGVQERIYQVGGSNAQRNVFGLTMKVALSKERASQCAGD